MVTGNKKYANEILDDIECYKAVLDGRINQFPKGFWAKPWSLQSAAVITRYLLEERLKYTEEDIKTKVSVQLFTDNKIYSLARLFQCSPYAIINNAYPGRFKPWELKSVPRGFWDDKDNITKAIRWLVETKLDNNRGRVCKEFNCDLLIKYGMNTISKKGAYRVLNIAYPNEFKPWELNNLPNGFWEKEENVKEAVRWIVETKLDNNRERVKKEFTREFLIKHGLSSLASIGLFKIIDLAYPNEFQHSDFKSGMQNRLIYNY